MSLHQISLHQAGEYKVKVKVEDKVKVKVEDKVKDKVKVKIKVKMVFARATIEVFNAIDMPVNRAMVSGHWEGATDDTDQGGTDAEGKVTLRSDWLKSPSGGEIFTFVVDDITKNDWVYDSSANDETSDSIIYVSP
jgi:uncharacterized OB-fold protein